MKVDVDVIFRALPESGLVWQVDRGNSRKVTLRREVLEHRFPGLREMVAAEGAPL